MSLATYGPAFIGAATALVAKPFVDWALARYRENQAYRAHMADRIRDFRESIAVLDSIRLLRNESFPVDTHVEKLGIPEHLVTSKAIDLTKLSLKTQKEGIKLSNQLANINRDTKSILQSKRDKNLEAFYIQADELSDKLRNLSGGWERSHPGIRSLIPAPEKGPKPIMFDDGRKSYGVPFTPEKPDALSR
jgi:hypothetical protein